jgi:hypothetical protein
MPWWFVGDNDDTIEYWHNGKEMREVDRGQAHLPPLYIYSADELQNVPLAGPPCESVKPEVKCIESA